MTAPRPLTVSRLENEARRSAAAGARPSRETDFATVMAAMRGQSLDPQTCVPALVLGPFESPGGDGRPLERFIFRVAGGDPLIEFEIELAPGQLPETAWRPSCAPIWRRSREA